MGLVLSLIGAVYVAVVPQEATDPHTEFFILGPEGRAEYYPTNLTTGETGTVQLGVTNREHESTTYSAFVVADDETLDRRQFTLAADATWQEAVSFSLQNPGRTRVWFLLFIGELNEPTSEPYRELYLIVEVSRPGNSSSG